MSTESIVVEIDRYRFLSKSNKALHIELFPAPDGEDKTSITPLCFFKVFI